nr:MAG TPA: hypothetical protein [Bacteriophage sp.]
MTVLVPTSLAPCTYTPTKGVLINFFFIIYNV